MLVINGGTLVLLPVLVYFLYSYYYRIYIVIHYMKTGMPAKVSVNILAVVALSVAFIINLIIYIL